MTTETEASNKPAAVNLYKIVYTDTNEDAGDGFLTLDNTANERPDWYEYWPIRQFLLGNRLDDDAFYGIFSPKFSSKTNMNSLQVDDFVRRNASEADVVLFSPQPDMGAFFLNVFEQGEVFDPGLIATVADFLDYAGHPTSLNDLIMDSRQIVFSNYFVARPRFWLEWLALNETLFAVCEGPQCKLRDELLQPTTYPGAAQRKVFVQERMASFLLATQPGWRSVPHNPYGMAWSMSRFREYPKEAIISDALKMAFRDCRFPQYFEAFAAIRDHFAAGSIPA